MTLKRAGTLIFKEKNESERFKIWLQVVSNVMVVGDKRKYLTCLITLKVTVDPATLAPTDQLDPRAIAWVESLGVKPNLTIEGGQGLSIEELLSSPDWPVVASAIQVDLLLFLQNQTSG